MTITRFFISVVVSTVLAYAQVSSSSPAPMRYGYMKHGVLIHQGDSVTIQTNDPRPLAQAVVASRREYGWLVDYEDPIYSKDDLIDARTPEFLQDHPRAKLMLAPKGREFSHTFNVDPTVDPASDSLRRSFITELVAAYGKSNNPGAFEVIETVPHRLTVVGRNTNLTSPLDQNVSITFNSEDGIASLEQILHSLSPIIGHKVGLGFVTPGPLLRCTIGKTYSNVSARTALLDVLEICHINAVYELLFDANYDTYLFNLDGVVTTITDGAGKKLLKPVNP